MDKKTIVALIVSFLIIVIYPHYLKMITPPGSVQEKSIETQQTVAEVPAEITKTKENLPPVEAAILEEETVLSNETLQLRLSNRGASVKEMSFSSPGYKSESVVIKEDKDNNVPAVFQVRLRNNAGVYFFDDEHLMYTLKKKDDASIVYESPLVEGVIIEKTISLKGTFDGAVTIAIKNMTETPLSFVMELSSGIHFDPVLLKEPDSSHIIYSSFGEALSQKTKKIVKQGFSIDKNIDWVSSDAKYATSILKPDAQIKSMRSIVLNNSNIITYVYTDVIESPANGEKVIENFFYAGPKDYTKLKAYNAGFESSMYKGFFGFLKLYLLITLNFFYGIFHNYGVAIILLTVLIKILFTPLTHKSFESMRKMQELQPQMKGLQEKYKDNPQQLNKEIMELYKKHKANPFGGCLPLLLQMPIFIALYQALSQSIELKGAPFIWWIKDLSEPDKLYTFAATLPIIGNSINVLPLLMIISMIWQQKLTPSTGNKEQERMMLIMSGVFGIIFYSLPSGLVLYWFVNNVLTIIHQSFMRRKKAA